MFIFTMQHGPDGTIDGAFRVLLKKFPPRGAASDHRGSDRLLLTLGNHLGSRGADAHSRIFPAFRIRSGVGPAPIMLRPRSYTVRGGVGPAGRVVWPPCSVNGSLLTLT